MSLAMAEALEEGLSSVTEKPYLSNQTQ